MARKQSLKTVAGVFQLLPDSILEQIGKEEHVDANVSRLYGAYMVKLLIFGMVRSERLSTRVLEEFYNSAFFSGLSGKGGHQTRHSSIADRLSTLPSGYFEKLFQYCVKHLGPKIKGSQRMVNKLMSFDSTLIAIGGGLIDWGMHVGAKPKDGFPTVQLKITLGLKGLVPSDVSFFHERKDLSEQRALKKAIEASTHAKNACIVFDRGLSKRQTLANFDKKGLQFITRCKTDLRYHKVEPYRQIKGRKANGLMFIQDSKVFLYASGDNLLEHPFRLVEAIDLETGKTLFFLTNIWDLTAMQIAKFYRKRWDIEVFFRFIKQELNIKHLINHTINGILIQIYSALISAMLILVYRTANKMTGFKIPKIRFEDQLLLLIVNELRDLRAPPTRLYY